jgi:hypothetical protein
LSLYGEPVDVQVWVAGGEVAGTGEASQRGGNPGAPSIKGVSVFCFRKIVYILRTGMAEEGPDSA